MQNLFAQRLKELREEQGLSMSNMAKQMGISHAQISCWEAGTRSPLMESIIALCKFFNVSADYLIGLSDH